MLVSFEEAFATKVFSFLHEMVVFPGISCKNANMHRTTIVSQNAGRWWSSFMGGMGFLLDEGWGLCYAGRM